MNAVIIDDEVNNIKNLKSLLNRYCPQISVVSYATNVDEGILLIHQQNPKIVFLDVQMPGENGFDLLKNINHPAFEVIFVTAYEKYAIDAIKFSAIDYLLKPVDISELVNAVSKAIANIERKMYNNRLENFIENIKHEKRLKVAIPGIKETFFIDPESILYCQAENNYTHFYLTTREKYTSSKPIFEYEELLTPYGFIRCHQSFLVNRHHIKKWLRTDGDRLLMEGQHEIPISRNQRQKVKHTIGIK